MLVRYGRWQQIRDEFTDAEKAEMRKAVSGECICPNGVFVEENEISPELCQKLKKALAP